MYKVIVVMCAERPHKSVASFLNILHGIRSNLESLVVELGIGELKDSRATIRGAIGAKT